MFYSSNSFHPHDRIFEETAGYLSRLHNVIASLSDAQTRASVADVIVTQVAPLLGAQSGVVFVLSDDGREFISLRISGYRLEVQNNWTRFAADSHVPLADAVRHHSMIVLETNTERLERYPHLADAGTDIPGALLAIPICHAGRAMGAVGFAFQGSRHFSESDRAFLLLLGEQCGAALARTQTLDPQQARMQKEPEETHPLADALRSSEERLRLLLAATNDGVWDWQPPTGEVFLSARWKEIMGTDGKSLPIPFEDWATRTHPDDWARVKTDFEAHWRGETPNYISEHRVCHDDGTFHWVLVRGLALRDSQDQVIRFLGTITDISERKESDEALSSVIYDLQAANERLEALATTDSLTGLKNERVFQERLADEFRRARRYQAPLSLILLDVDHFKSYNDTHGHPAGSRALRRLAQILQQGARETDIVCRYGGEEFVILLPHTHGVDATALAERLRASVEAAPWKRRALTVSVGVCNLAPGMTEALALLDQVDAALYEAKAAGRNCVVSVCTDPVPLTLPLDFNV